MAQHAHFTLDSGLQIYVCDPSGPWQRGSNENTNSLRHQYFPKEISLAAVTQEHLDAVADELDGRHRQTIGFCAPSEQLAEAVALTA